MFAKRGYEFLFRKSFLIRALNLNYLRGIIDANKYVPKIKSRENSLGEAISWLYRSMDAGTEDCSRCFRLSTGWSACYPEVTGYNLYTLLDHYKQTKSYESFSRALKMAKWELTVQLPSGAFQSGYTDQSIKPVVFNTAQVLQGLTRAYTETGDEVFLRGAERAANWLVSVQDPDGAWRKYCYLDEFRVTDTRIALPLVELWKVTNIEKYLFSATKSLDYVISQQHSNGWWPRCDNSPSRTEEPNTHTLSYVVEGLILSGLILNRSDYVESGRKTADSMLRRFEIDKFLYGRYDKKWKPTVKSSCLTGNAQIAICWLKLYGLDKNPWYLNAAIKMLDFLCEQQNITSNHPGIRGALPGSYPLGGDYQTYIYPSWATKYFCDALMLEREALSKFLPKISPTTPISLLS